MATPNHELVTSILQQRSADSNLSPPLSGRSAFFFQAEDGIRDLIGLEFRRVLFRSRVVGGWNEFQFAERRMPTLDEINAAAPRSEERRVGKECRSRWWAEHLKNK